MQTKFGDYLFIIIKSSIGFVLSVATLDNTHIIDLKISIKTLENFCSILEQVAMGTESNFIKVPMANSTFQHVIYVYRSPHDYNNINISIYKQSLIDNKDILIVKTCSCETSGEIDNLFSICKNI